MAKCFVIHFIVLLINSLTAYKIGLTLNEMDKIYSKLLNLPPADGVIIKEEKITKDSEVISLQQLEMAIFYSDIMQIFKSFGDVSEFGKFRQKEIYEGKWKDFKQLLTTINDQRLETSKLCELWKFWHELGETFVNFHMLANEFELVIKKRLNPDVNAVDCSQIENIGRILVFPLKMQIFENDIKLAHFSAIMFLMQPQKESELRIRIGGLTKPGNFIGDFSQFFGTARLKFETNFAHRLRLWHITGNVEKIAEVKMITTTLFGADILERIEFHQPVTMALEHVDDGRLAVEYAKMIFSDYSDKYELKLSARMLFGRIWTIFTKVNSLKQTKKAQNKKPHKNLAKIEQLWNEQANALMEHFINVDDGKLGHIYEFWHKLAILNNKIWKNVDYELVLKQIGNLQQIKHQILPIIRVELIDEHCETMAKLFESENAFSECLKKSRIDGTGTRQRLLEFLVSKLDADGQSLEWNAFLSYQNIGKLLRINLTAEEVNQLQIKNYVKFLDLDTDETESKKMHLLLDLLAFYQWMKNRLGGTHLSAKSANYLKQNFELMELWMDAVGALKDGTEADKQREAYNTLTYKVAQMYFGGDKIWQNDDGKTEGQKTENGTKKWENMLNKLHLDILDTLLIDRQEFGEKLGDIYLNIKRMNQIISSDTKVFVNLLKKSRSTPNLACLEQNNGEEQQKKGGKAPEEEINEEGMDIHLLMVSYKNLLLLERTCNAMAKERMTVDSALFVHKTELRRLLNLVGTMKDGQKPNLKRAAVQIEVEAARADFFARPTATEEKLKSICRIKAFSDKIVHNGTLNESPQWKDELKKIIGIFYLFENDETSGRKLLNPDDCEHSQFVNAILAELNKSPMVEMIHIFTIVSLTQSVRDFAEFVVHNAYSLPKTRFYTHIDDSERIHFYNLILATDDPNQALMNEAILSLKLLINSAKTMETAQSVSDAEIAMPKAQTFAVLNILEIFSTKFVPFQMLCPTVYYLNFLKNKQKNPAQKWAAPLKCLLEDLEETFTNLRMVLAREHFEFVNEYLREHCDQTKDGPAGSDQKINELIRILMEKSLAIARLGLLVSPNLIGLLLSAPKIRAKLLNTNFFNDQKRLFGHYLRFLSANDLCQQMNERMAADISVWMRWLQRQQSDRWKGAGGEEIVRESFEVIWLFYRIKYDSFKCQYLAPKEVAQFSYQLVNLVQRVKEFTLNDKNKHLEGPKLENCWINIKESANSEGRIQWINSGGKAAPPPSTAFAQWHFEELQKYSTDGEQSDEEANEMFQKIIKGLNENRDQRKKLTQLLKLEDIKKLFNLHKIEFDKNDFIGGESGENDQKKQKRKKKEQKKKKIASENKKSENAVTNSLQIRRQNEQKMASDKKENEMPQNKGETDNLTPKFEQKSEKEINLKKLATELAKINSLAAFCNDLILFEKYKEFVLEPFEEKLKIVNIAAYVNEIEQRIKVIAELGQFKFLHYFSSNLKSNGHNLGKEWTRILEEISNWANAVDKLDKIENKLQIFLATILNFLDGNAAEIDYKNQNLEVQIHAKNLAMAILNDKKFEENFWRKFKKNKKELEKLFRFFQFNFAPMEFEESKMEKSKMLWQIEIDQQIYEKINSKKESDEYLLPNFPKKSQQLTHFANIAEEMKFVENLENHLTKEAKSEDGNNVKERFDRKIKESLKKIHKIVDKWSDKRARLLISGSFLLGSYTFCSDVDLICLVPRKTVTQMDFFANNQTICMAGKCTPPSNDTNRSLYCRLCTNANVRGLVKINYGTVFLIKFEFDGTEFDLTFVSIPSRKDLPVQINDESIKSFLDKFASGNADDAKMLRVLSSYRSVRYVANLLSLDTANGDWTRILNDDAAGGGHQSEHQKSSKISKKFRNLLLSLKLWAKKKFIYSNRFGYFNGAMLTIMATKIMLLYPNASLPFLFEKFFLIYSTRPFDIPIQIKKLENASKLNLFPPINLAEAQMFVFTPSFPEQNAAKFVTYSTAKIIQKEIISAMNDIRSMGIGNYFDWTLTNSTPFTEKFDYFILVNCAGEMQIGTDKFCQFVDGRIRLEFVYEIGIETRLYPNYFGQTCQMPKHFEAFNDKGIMTNYCKVWLAGVNIPLSSAPDYLGESLSKMLNGFDLAIKRAYLRFNPNNDAVQNDGQKSESDDIQTIYRKLKFDIKSMVVERRSLIEEL